jgi:copper chaperone CopZ
MKKIFRLVDLDCANCAAKMEAAISTLEGVESASVSFMSQKLTLAAADHAFDAVLEQAREIIKKIEPDSAIMP